MRKPRYWEVLLVLSCTSFYISNFKGFEGFTGIGILLSLFTVMKYFDYLAEK